MRKYQRKTQDEYTVQGFYNGVWEDVTSEETYSELKARLKEYRENERGTAFRWTKRRIKISELN